VKPGDVVQCMQWENGQTYLGSLRHHIRDGKYGVAAYQEAKRGDVEVHFYLDADAKFRIISRAPRDDTPKLWRDMTDAEKGALLLAHHRGEVIEGRAETWPDGEWSNIPVPSWNYDSAYRVRPEPKVETVKLAVWRMEGHYYENIGTINMIDGKPDVSSIKMEEL